ncbi:MAG: hypothetical protein LBI45_07355 [Bacteroidales bacterium]|jgi:hypothetical protein|nr:hypothetical protein [Bacteroidales bacterium]
MIKDVTGDNAGYIMELRKEGYPEGTIVRQFTYSKSNNACYFDNCVAYVGETCEFILTK